MTVYFTLINSYTQTENSVYKDQSASEHLLLYNHKLYVPSSPFLAAEHVRASLLYSLKQHQRARITKHDRQNIDKTTCFWWMTSLKLSETNIIQESETIYVTVEKQQMQHPQNSMNFETAGMKVNGQWPRTEPGTGRFAGHIGVGWIKKQQQWIDYNASSCWMNLNHFWLVLNAGFQPRPPFWYLNRDLFVYPVFCSMVGFCWNNDVQ